MLPDRALEQVPLLLVEVRNPVAVGQEAGQAPVREEREEDRLGRRVRLEVGVGCDQAAKPRSGGGAEGERWRRDELDDFHDRGRADTQTQSHALNDSTASAGRGFQSGDDHAPDDKILLNESSLTTRPLPSSSLPCFPSASNSQ